MKDVLLLGAFAAMATLLNPVAALAQVFPAAISEKFDSFRNTILEEKIFIHLDQRFYLVGESLWFSAYCVDASFHMPLAVSKVAYVEVLDKNHQPVLQSKIALSDGRGTGVLYLPATLSSGNYVLRAYTAWMKNWDPAFYFHQPITIVNPFVSAEKEKVAQNNVTVGFFPEGGNLVKGMRSVVAFRATDQTGKGVWCQGSVIDAENDTVARFSPLKFGIGRFEITPGTGPYRAVVKDNMNRVSFHNLPPVRNDGYTLSVSDSTARWLKVTAQGRFEGSEGSFVYLFSHARRIVSYALAGRLRENRVVFLIEKQRLPEGVTHFTLFNEGHKPVAERLFFRAPESDLEMTAVPSSGDYGTRKNVSLEINTSTVDRNPVAASVSIAVTRIDSAVHKPSKSISHYMWLSSDLMGDIESEEYYFTRPDSLSDEATDNLMLTHGWRRFRWDDVLTSQRQFNWLPEYHGHIINAMAQTGGENAAGALTFLSIPGNALSLYSARSNQHGELRFEVTGLTGANKVILQPHSSEGNLALSILSPFSSRFRKEDVTPFSLPAGYEKGFLRRSIAMQAQDIYQSGYTQAVPEARDTIAFYGRADEAYFLDDYTRFPVMEEVMREYVPGVFVRKRKDGFHFLVPDMVGGYMLEGDPLILLDGVPLFDADKVMNIDPLKIRKLEVVKRRFFQGPATYAGIVSYTTYDGDIAGIELNPGAVTVDYDGLQLAREFYSPQYSTLKRAASRIPDRRYLLYWDPQAKTDEDGTLHVEFYTSDVPGYYEINVQGLTSSGRTGSATQYFQVK